MGICLIPMEQEDPKRCSLGKQICPKDLFSAH
jgi:hypothetical protein